MQFTRKNVKVARNIIAGMINASEGTFLGLSYVRKDGSLTRLNGRICCHLETVSGKTSKPASGGQELFHLYDVKRRGYRSISLDRIERVTLRGQTYDVLN